MNSSTWAAMAAAAIPATAALVAAWIASRSARAARDSQATSEHLARLEQRLATHKRQVYEPMIELLGNMLNRTLDGDDVKSELEKFGRWIVVVGSDEAVLAFRNLMQAAFHSAPAQVLLRLFAEFQLAARRDMGDPTTSITAVDILALRINDLFSDSDDGKLRLHRVLSVPFEQACKEAGWEIPWLARSDSAERRPVLSEQPS